MPAVQGQDGINGAVNNQRRRKQGLIEVVWRGYGAMNDGALSF
jgi:hypothetical protein